MMNSPFNRTDAATTLHLFRRLWRDWIRKHRYALIGIFALMGAVSALSGVYPVLIRHVFNAIDQANPDLVWRIPPLIIAVALVRGMTMYGLARGVAILVLRVTTGIQKRMAAHLIDADLAVVVSTPSGALVSRMINDINLIREALNRLISNLIRDSLTIVVLVGVMLWFDWLLTLAALVVYPLAMRPILAIGRRQRKGSRNLQEQTGEAMALLGETLKGSRMVRAYGLQGYEKERTANMFSRLYGEQIKLAMGRARVDPILEVLGGFAVAGIVALAGWRVLGGFVDIGNVAGFITALLMMAQPMRGLGTLNTVLQEAAAALSRLYDLLDIRPEITSPERPVRREKVEGHLVFDRVGFRYGDVVAVSDVSFEARRGETVALVGPSGGGKTTIINLIPRLYDPTEGVIRLDGVDLRDLELAALRGSIALVGQDAILFNDTIAANIAFGRLDAGRDAIISAARAAAADEFITALPEGYETVVGEEGQRLSGGERQRVAIARAILRDAPVLLLDEPTSALDAATGKQIREALERLSEGRTTIIVAHRLETVRAASCILVVQEGRIIERGGHDELLALGGVYADLCRSQHFN